MDHREGTADAQHPKTGNVLLAIVTSLLVIAGLKWTGWVTMSLAFAAFLIALCWPIQEALNRRLSPGQSYVGTTIALFVVLAALVAILYATGQSVASALPKYSDEFERLLGSVRNWVTGHGLPAPQQMFDASNLEAIVGAAVAGTYHVLGVILLILALTILGLPAVPRLHESIRNYFGGARGREIVEITEKVARRVQRWLAAGTLTSGITGILTWLYALALGLDLAFLWGVIAWILNYIPTVGSALAVIPPTLFALVQFDGLLMPLAVFLGLSVIQLVMGNFVFPQVAGRTISVMPVLLLFSIAFWGWVWGVAGAIIATPLTTTLVIVCGEFRSTRWIAALVSRETDIRPDRPPRELGSWSDAWHRLQRLAHPSSWRS